MGTMADEEFEISSYICGFYITILWLIDTPVINIGEHPQKLLHEQFTIYGIMDTRLLLAD